jgi:hypothetical protein
LLFVHLLWSSEADAALSGVGTAGIGPFANEIPLKLGDAGEDGHDHFAGVGGGIRPRFGDGLKAGTGLPNQLGDIEQVAGGTGQTVTTSPSRS